MASPSHQTDPAGCCISTCQHPAHDGPVLVAMPADMLNLATEWLTALGFTVAHVPVEPDALDGHRLYAATQPDPASSPINGTVRAGNPPRVKAPWERR
jgi:hypothetical protein